jgi:hypothetical protein
MKQTKQTNKVQEHSGELNASSVVFMVNGKKVAQRLSSNGVNAVGI